MDQPNYHVLLDGRMVGPYDRKTIIGMRIKRMLTGDHLLVTGDGTQLTVRELVGAAASRPAAPGSASRALATYSALLVEADRRGFLPIPRFSGELELRVHHDMLRLAGRHRRGFGWKECRVKLPLKDVAHARTRGPRVDLWLQREGSPRLQHLAVHLFTAEAAEQLLGTLPPVATDPGQPAAAAAVRAAAAPAMSTARVLGIAVAGVAVVIVLVLLALTARRIY